MPVADDQIRREIGTERQELALAVASLRGELRRAKRRLPKLAAGTLVAGVALMLVVKRLRRR
jgi:hypothetical protein